MTTEVTRERLLQLLTQPWHQHVAQPVGPLTMDLLVHRTDLGGGKVGWSAPPVAEVSPGVFHIALSNGIRVTVIVQGRDVLSVAAGWPGPVVP